MILVTGANGQLGQELQALKKAYPFDFHFTDFEKLDITHSKRVNELFELQHFDYCINAAAYTAVDNSENDKLAAYEVNVVGTTNLAKACEKHGVRLIHISTDFVFDGKKNTPYTENDIPNPKGVYGTSKWQGEKNALLYNPHTIILRTAWLYSSFGKNFIKTMLSLTDKNPLNVVYDQIGSPTYARDLADTILQIILSMEGKKFVEPHLWGTYNYTNEGIASWYDFAQSIFEFSKQTKDKKVNLQPIRSVQFPTPAERPSYSVLDKSKIKQNFDIEIPHWRDALKRCLKKM
ncbi:dTDP-4-dehydrorhamnose reductase [Bernardetia sp. OM2101]|uniref:dTDP-4-dehydrorhamnose reductase n=1 Tax=Bernardetia sp. OM2101 TaxID=3344876 RepID=UPI0035CFF548